MATWILDLGRWEDAGIRKKRLLSFIISKKLETPSLSFHRRRKKTR